ncbi:MULTISPECIES: branched-chain amino acid ABC transporter permease [Micromonospora]|uniref:Amino acid/amide ABC transporter membrane protein 1, HAAT family n=1 Tax=Micromonospora yangpuensis TaxID=683228 RepID=A0A1C6UZ44_9ACTN|nr:branched-chain amino acid ABC transporter permease [Micromonospora yangpuensis]GGL95814.1 branched-chain amino acid ABC transporter permease [Micromonospora yangpuensis]SCL59279.1 amino acid/amide ABC transporter membrane protein 1, HAAT family [Micromonospora yangpuensis]
MNFAEFFGNFPALTITGLEQGAIYALVALGYTLVYGVLRLINFAHSEVFMVGTFTALWTWQALGYSQNSAAPAFGAMLVAVIIGLLAAAAASALTAVTVEVVAYRPLRKRNAPPLAFLITAIGASFVIAEAFGVGTNRAPFGMPVMIPSETLFTVFGAAVTNIQLLVLGVTLAMMVALDQFVNRSRLGRGIRAVAQDADTAALMGVNKNRVIMLVFILGGLMAGVAALLWSLRYGYTKFNVGFLIGLKAFSAAVLGGIGNLRGALLGGLLLGIAENYAAGLFGGEWKDFTGFVLLVVLLMFRPTGLLGESLGRARA